jgi:predicted ATP-dependent protease
VIERDKAAAMLPLAAEKVAAETKRIAQIKSRQALAPGWLNGALRAAGVIKEGESL